MFPQIRFLLSTVLILSFFSVFGQANKLYHKVFTKQDGLDFDNVTAMVFDNDGFLWLGGQNLDTRSIIANDKKLTIQRFDGQRFDSFKLPEINVPVESVEHFFKRDDGKFYVSGIGIFSLFDPVTQKFTPVPQIPLSRSSIFPYKGQNYILTQIDREITLHILNDDLTFTKLFSFTSSENKFLVDEASKIVFHEKGVLISDDNFPLLFFDWNGDLLKRYPIKDYLSSKVGGLSDFMIDEVFYKEEKIYAFILNNQQLQEIDFDDLMVRPVLMPNSLLNETTIYSYEQGDSNLVLHTSGQDLMINRFTENGFESTTARGIFNKPYGIRCASTDLNKDLWVGNSGGELHYFKFPSRKIKVLLPEYEMRAIVPFKTDTYLVCTEKNGWFEFNETTEQINPFELSIDNKKLAPNSTRNISVEEDTLWFHGFGFFKANRKTKEASFYKHYPVLCFEPLNKDAFVYGTSNYYLMNFNKKTLKHDSIVKTDTLTIYDLAIHENIIMGSTDKGVLRYNLKEKKVNMFSDLNILGDPFLLMADYQEPYGFVFGSRDGTISSYDEKSKKYNTIYKDELGAGIAKIVYDGPSWWISTFNGLVNFNIETKELTRFSTKDGLSNNEGNRYSGVKTKNGMLIGSLKGLNYFNPDNLQPETTKSQLKFLRCYNYNTDAQKLIAQYNQNTLNNNKAIVLPTEHKELEIAFALTHNVTQNEHSYRYRLNNNDWVHIGKEQVIRFINLASGNYDLEIEATDFSGNKIGESLRLKIDSKQFFYKTWWFYLLFSIAAISLLLYLLRQSKLRQRLTERFSRELLGSQEKERTRIAKELHDSVGQQLTLIKKKAQSSDANEIANLTNTTLEEVRAISRGLYPTALAQLGLTESIEQLVLNFDEASPAFYSLDIDLIDTYFNEEETLNVYRFVQETLNNSVKHSNATSIVIEILERDKNITVRIKDNGDGFIFKEAALENSLGLKTLRERIKILKGTFNIESKVNQGTIISAAIPK